MHPNKKKWLIQAPVGLALVGFGLCLLTEAGNTKFGGADWTVWVPYGTLALVVFNSGLSIFGNAILHRVRYERAQAERP